MSVTGFALKYPVHFLFGLSEISRHLRERSYNLKLETLTKPSFNEFQLGLRNIHPRKIDNAGEEGGGVFAGILLRSHCTITALMGFIFFLLSFRVVPPKRCP